MKNAIRIAALLAVVIGLNRSAGFANAQGYTSVWYDPVRHYGYVYYPPPRWATPAPAYFPGRYLGTYYGLPLPPYGFGNPYYNGYNDPLLNAYGPGVRQFLLFGGANFYGW